MVDRKCDYYYYHTHWFPHCDHSMQLDNVGVVELAHDGCLL